MYLAYFQSHSTEQYQKGHNKGYQIHSHGDAHRKKHPDRSNQGMHDQDCAQNAFHNLFKGR